MRSGYIKSDLAKSDATPISDEAYDEIPEIDDAMFARGFWSIAGRPLVGLATDHPRLARLGDAAHGETVVRNGEVAVGTILDMLASGATIADVTERHPALSREDVMAAQSYAADLVRRERMFAVR